ncbi:flavin reductase family protein [Streptomyces sp. 184]|uniref:flavin reductase family protein n=1 Tax=Streptomyces sp. 184 TaxID=1827526 RepID=UPI003892BEF1
MVVPLRPADSGTPESGADPGAYREAMRHWATGIAVVTTRGARGAYDAGGACDARVVCSTPAARGPHGMTANSLLSVSLHPPTLLISLQRGSRTRDLIRETCAFTVNILAADQRALADHFARRDAVGDEFAGVDHRPSPHGGGPELAGSAAVLACRTTGHVEVADHTLIIAEVTAVRSGGPGEPLLYLDRRYRRLGADPG